MARYRPQRARRKFQGGGGVNGTTQGGATQEAGAQSAAAVAPTNTLLVVDPTEGIDKITDTVKVTAGYFAGGGGELTNTGVYTSSLANVNEDYYFNISDQHPLSSSAKTIFSVAYGHVDGSGSLVETGTVGETETIYKQWAQLLLPENEVTGGFKISAGDKFFPSNRKRTIRDHDIYILLGKRERFKDRINKKNWTIQLSGSQSVPLNLGSPSSTSGSQILHLTDDSATRTQVVTPAGPRYNIVSGSDGSVQNAADQTTYGWFWPNFGVMVFSAAELSASIPGEPESTTVKTAFYQDPNSLATAGTGSLSVSMSKGFAPNLTSNFNAHNALRFVNCLRNHGGKLKFRSEEDQVSVSYFCRVKAPQANFSTNKTFTSGSNNPIRHEAMWSDPNVFITGIGLVNNIGQIVATGKLSTPIKKNFGSEATIKVKLTY